MKQQSLNVLMLFCFLFMANQLLATHNRAGEITYKQIGDLLFEATITTYTKLGSIQADRDSLELFWGDGTSEWVIRSNGNGVVVGNDIKKNVYIATHTYPGTGSYTLSMTDPNRNGGILNLNYPYSDQVPFHLETYLKILNPFFNGYNSSPILTNPPIDNGCLNQVFMHNPMAIDPDGDSIAFELIPPYQSLGASVSNYQYPNNIGGGNQFFALDPQTGSLTWDAPQQAGEYNIAFYIKEYRNGVLISRVVRDMQVTIENCNNHSPIITQLPPIQVEAGDTVSFDVIVSDFENHLVDLSANGNMLDNGSASFTVLNNNTTNPVGKFVWSTNCNDLQVGSYFVVFRAADDYQFNNNPYSGTSYQVQEIKVVDDFAPFCTASTHSPVKSSIFQKVQVFPNPTTEMANVKVEVQDLSFIRIQVMSLTGRLLDQIQFNNHDRIEHTIDVSRYSSGIYLVRIIVNGEVQTQKIIVE